VRVQVIKGGHFAPHARQEAPNAGRLRCDDQDGKCPP